MCGIPASAPPTPRIPAVRARGRAPPGSAAKPRELLGARYPSKSADGIGILCVVGAVVGVVRIVGNKEILRKEFEDVGFSCCEGQETGQGSDGVWPSSCAGVLAGHGGIHQLELTNRRNWSIGECGAPIIGAGSSSSVLVLEALAAQVQSLGNSVGCFRVRPSVCHDCAT